MRKSRYFLFVFLLTTVISCLLSCSKEDIYKIIPGLEDSTEIVPDDTIPDIPINGDSISNDTIGNDSIQTDTIGNDTIPGGETGGGGNTGGDSGGGNTGGDSGGGTSGGGGSSGGGGTSGGGTTQPDDSNEDYTVLYVEHYSLNDILANMKNTLGGINNGESSRFDALWKALEMSVAYISKNEKKITKIALKYPSVDAQGKKAYLSGVVYLHYGAKDINEIIVASHYTTSTSKEVPSHKGTEAMEAFLCMRNANIMVVASDYLGYGESEKYVHPYLNEDLAARNQIDLLKQAKKYIAAHNISLETTAKGLKTYSTGYSQGGAVAMAVHKAFDANNSLAQEYGFKQSFCGDGPYDPMATFNYYLTKGSVEMPFVLPLVLAGMQATYPDLFKGINMNDYFSDKLRAIDIINMVKSKKYSSLDIDKKMIETVGNDSIKYIMSKKAMNMNSDIMVKLKTALERNNLADGSWSPHHKMLMHHSKNDQLVPYVNYQSCQKVFPKTYFVDSNTTKNSNQHVMEALHFYTALLIKHTYKL